jgi:hypothetical protein
VLVLAGGSIATPAGADLKQVIPFIDANLRTIATKKARAVAGVSLGGLGAFHYTQARPDLYSQTASLSGDIDLSANSMDLRMAVAVAVTDALGTMCASSSGYCDPDESAFKPGVDSDALSARPTRCSASAGGGTKWTRPSTWTGSPAQGSPTTRAAGLTCRHGVLGRGQERQGTHGRPGHALLLRQLRRRFRLGARCNGGPTAGRWEQDLQFRALERAFAS